MKNINSKDRGIATTKFKRMNLKKYLESMPKEDGLQYLKNWLSRRKEIKNLNIAPMEFECKSLMFPSLIYWDKKYGINTYNKICSDLELYICDYNSRPIYNESKSSNKTNTT